MIHIKSKLKRQSSHTRAAIQTMNSFNRSSDFRVAKMLAFGLLVAILLGVPTTVTASPGDTVAACDPTQDIYFDNKLQFTYATTVRSIVYNNTFVTVRLQWSDYNGPGSANYVFVRRGAHSSP
jgi:hypothetical protein